MKDKKTLLDELKERFDKTKKELRFKSIFEDIDEIFFIKDLVLEKGFISEDFSNQLRGRMAEVFIFWDNYLHNLVMPNPQNLFIIHESKVFNEVEKKDIMKMMSRISFVISKNTVLRLSRNKKEEGKIIDEFVGFWKNSYQPFYLKIMEKIRDRWKDEK